MSRVRRAVVCLVAIATITGCAAEAPPEALSSASSIQVLPSPDVVGSVPLETVLAARRSARSFSSQPLRTIELGQLLWAGQGVTDAAGHRTAPSAGALYPLELYVVTPDRLLHYLPVGHRLESRVRPDVRAQLRAAALDQAVIGAAPYLLVIAAVPARTAAKYGRLAAAFVDREAGHAAQNVLLEATALGLSAVPIGGFEPERVRRVLALPPGEDVRYLIPVGRPAA